MRSFVIFTDYLVVRRSLPMFLSLVGISFAIIRWNRHPHQSLMTIIALTFYFIESWMAGLFFNSLLPNFLPMTVSDTTRAYLYFNEDFAFAAVLILLVIAAFTGRRDSPINVWGKNRQ